MSMEVGEKIGKRRSDLCNMELFARASSNCMMILLLLILLAAQSGTCAALRYPCSSSFSSFAFCNTSLPIPDRVNDLVGRLSLHEKARQLINSAHGVPRLGIPKYEWWNEALHGVSNSGPGTKFGGSIPGAVSFPQVILTAASFNASLWRKIGEVISTEARAMYNLGQTGLTYWSPNINIFRDPRWGRGQETPGEDPLVASTYALNFVQGLQGIEDSDSEKSLKVGACCKHFSAYDLDQWNGVDRFHFNAEVTEQDLQDTYQPPFQTCVEKGEAACVMCSYNRINGVPACANKNLLTDIARNQWKLNGYITSDCDSVQVMYEDAHYTAQPEGSVADSILAGLNLNCGEYLSNYTERAVTEGLLKEEHVDTALSYLYTTLMRLGYFNGNPRKQKWGSLGPDDVCTDENRELALEAAKQGIVLLKNKANTLPLSKEISTVAVIGPNADDDKVMIGNYAGVPCRMTTVLRGIQRYADVLHVVGCKGGVACNETTSDDMAEVVTAASRADAVVLVMGLDQTQERESFDRRSLLLPGAQSMLVATTAAAARGPVVLLLLSGGPVDVTSAQNNRHVHAILWAGYPGEAGGDAIAEVLFGDHNPAGRLPNTWYRESYVAWPMTDMRMRADPTTGYPGRTYRFHDHSASTLYPFGHGLSYTTFSVSISTSGSTLQLCSNCTNQTCSPSLERAGVCSIVVNVADIHTCPDLQVDVDVENQGSRDGSYAVLLMWHPTHILADVLGAPTQQLVGFERIWVPTRQSSCRLYRWGRIHHPCHFK